VSASRRLNGVVINFAMRRESVAAFKTGRQRMGWGTKRIEGNGDPQSEI
jgi:hypothetical protein